MLALNIVLDVLVLAMLVVPFIIGLVKGFVYSLLHLGKTLIAFIFACAFVKKLGAWIKEKWIYQFVRDNIAELFVGSEESTEGSLVSSIPEGIRNTLAAIGLDVDTMASEAVAQGEAVEEKFIESVSQGVSGVLSFVLAFGAIFLISILAILLLRPLIDWLARTLPVVKTWNRILGAIFGLLLGIIFSWVGSQIFVGVAGLVAYHDWTSTYLLSFFYQVNPLRWLLQVVVRSIASISVL